MRYPSSIKLTGIEKAVAREGFSEPYHKVTFDLISEGIPTSQMSVWVHPAYPEAELVRVSRTFVWSRLAALLEASKQETFSEDEIQDLWERVKPAEFFPK
ncbi:MAG: hypothetical protein AAF889_15280 [Cyanobacteria bacterium P01_D01_bin.73]